MSRRPPRTPAPVRGFDRSADLYERSRPDYPGAAVRFLGRVLGAGPGTTVVELGSGTGKFTRAIAGWGAARIAIEPTAGMRAVFRRTVPDVALLDGTAEEIPLPDGCADAVVSAQAFHWFRPRPTLRELRRVLRPRGSVGLVWNTRDEHGWSGRLSALLRPYGYRSRGRTDDDASWERAFAAPTSGFTRVRYRAFPHAQWGPPSLFVQRALSVSHIASLAPTRQREVARAVRRLLATDPETRGRSRLRLPMVTEVYWSRRR
jgi:SAM-dependent methyltransferase